MRPDFPEVDVDALEEVLRELPSKGKLTRFRGAFSCVVCRRRVGALGRVLQLGMLTCNGPDCQVTSLGEITKLFKTPYGPSLGVGGLSVFSRVFSLDSGRILVATAPIRDHARALAEGFESLIAWQAAWDDHAWWRWPDEYAEGKTILEPPRGLEDVLVLRATTGPVPREPITHLQSEYALEIDRIRRRGVESMDLGF